MTLKKKFLKFGLPVVDAILAPIVFFGAWIFKFVRIAGVWRMPFCKSALLKAGVFPVRDHYYEPLFNSKHLRHNLDQDRPLPGIDWNTEEQLALLHSFHFQDELIGTPASKSDDLTFWLSNPSFNSGDAEYLYNLIRHKKPRRIIEIGSGNSTLIAIKAIKKSQAEVLDYACDHICIEPYEMPWLEKTGATIIRKKVEVVPKELFQSLKENDLLFIDSSHIIRPQGDVLFEFLEILPLLNTGVIVHVHDIFSPRDYPKAWVQDAVYFWNEQYLLEAFLTCNAEWKIIGALNFLRHHHFRELQSKCRFLTDANEPGSFYIQKV